MRTENKNRFEDFFAARRYATLKNLLYNYRIRRALVRKILDENGKCKGPVLEVGSGISPLLVSDAGTIQSDLSLNAMTMLKSANPAVKTVVADVTDLPFKSGIFQFVICSEVIEHVERDELALKEIGRVLEKNGKLILTFPHREKFFGIDDRYVKHFRRYELDTILGMLSCASLRALKIRKVLGPCEKVTMSAVVFCIQAAELFGKSGFSTKKALSPLFIGIFDVLNVLYAFLMRLDAMIWPRSFSSVLLVETVKD